jgi:hypothetical protein
MHSIGKGFFSFFPLFFFLRLLFAGRGSVGSSAFILRKFTRLAVRGYLRMDGDIP